MQALRLLQDWYFSNCNGDWEHDFGVKIETLDNPGWMLRIDLSETTLDGKDFPGYSYGLDRDDDDWVDCNVADKQFKAAGGPFKLEEMVEVFLAWAGGDLPNYSLKRTNQSLRD